MKGILWWLRVAEINHRTAYIVQTKVREIESGYKVEIGI